MDLALVDLYGGNGSAGGRNYPEYQDRTGRIANYIHSVYDIDDMAYGLWNDYFCHLFYICGDPAGTEGKELADPSAGSD